MMYIGFVVAVILFFLLFLFVLRGYTDRIAGTALTDKFKAAEAIANGSIPELWIKQIDRQAGCKGVRHSLSREELLIQKLDKLHQYFEVSPFVENPETRKILLDAFSQARSRWIHSSWEDLVSNRIPNRSQE